MNNSKIVAPRRPRSMSVTAIKQKLKPIVVVLGMHRSGTSLCSHILSTVGINMATDISANDGNQKGHWECWEIVAFNDRVLNLFNRQYFSPSHDFSLPSGWWADPRLREIEKEIEKFISERLIEDEVFGFKDPRTSILLPMWARIFRKLKLRPHYILCLRSPADIARSLNSREGLEYEIGEYRSIRYMFDILKNVKLSDICVIDYNSWFDNAIQNIDKICNFIGYEPEISKCEILNAAHSIISVELNRSGRHSSPVKNIFIRESYDNIQRLLDGGEGAGERLSRLIQSFAYFQSLIDIFEAKLLQAANDHQNNMLDIQKNAEIAQAALLAEHAGRADIERQHAELIAALQAKDAELLAEHAGRADIERQHAESIAALQAKDAELLARACRARRYRTTARGIDRGPSSKGC